MRHACMMALPPILAVPFPGAYIRQEQLVPGMRETCSQHGSCKNLQLKQHTWEMGRQKRSSNARGAYVAELAGFAWLQIGQRHLQAGLLAITDAAIDNTCRCVPGAIPVALLRAALLSHRIATIHDCHCEVECSLSSRLPQQQAWQEHDCCVHCQFLAVRPVSRKRVLYEHHGLLFLKAFSWGFSFVLRQCGTSVVSEESIACSPGCVGCETEKEGKSAWLSYLADRLQGVPHHPTSACSGTLIWFSTEPMVVCSAD